MANFKMVDTDQLDADLTKVASSIREKGGTSGQLEFPSGFAAAVAAISTGVEVQRKSGTFSPSSGSATVNCGFKPDVVMIHRNRSYEGYLQTCAVNFADDTRGTTLETGLWDGSSCEIYGIVITQSSTGFTVKMTAFDADWGESSVSGSFNYAAVKFTE